MKFPRDEDGGFIVEAATVQDPIGFAIALCDEHGVPLWGRQLVETLRRYRYFTGPLTMVNDENNGTAWVDETGRDRYTFAWNAASRSGRPRRWSSPARCSRPPGPSAALQTGSAQHPRARRMPDGQRPQRSVVDAHGESHDVPVCSSGTVR